MPGLSRIALGTPGAAAPQAVRCSTRGEVPLDVWHHVAVKLDRALTGEEFDALRAQRNFPVTDYTLNGDNLVVVVVGLRPADALTARNAAALDGHRATGIEITSTQLTPTRTPQTRTSQTRTPQTRTPQTRELVSHPSRGPSPGAEAAVFSEPYSALVNPCTTSSASWTIIF